MRLPSILISAGLFFSASTHAFSTDVVEKAPAKQSTLSRLGIDFGAAELLRFGELGLSDKQKIAALKVVRDQKPEIDTLCLRMTKALQMNEAEIPEKKAKQAELAEILELFKTVQTEIMDGLHAIVTKEQMQKLNELKKREKQQKLKTKAEPKAVGPS